MNEPDLEKFQNIINIHFKNTKLLTLALTHKSYGISKNTNEWNERMEFLGDSILSAVTADYLYYKFPNATEGELSRIKSYLVSRQMLSRWAKKINIGEYILLSQSEEATGGRTRESIISNAFEALIGAIYLEKGYSAVQKFIKKNLESENLIYFTDYKSKLQEIIQKKFHILPVYNVIKETGPEHEKLFSVVVKVRKTILGKGTGKNKKEAEQQAAKQALNFIAKNKLFDI